MSNDIKPPEDGNIRVLLRESYPTPSLPSNFQASVWHRIERMEDSASETGPAFAWLERWVERLLLPRFALASLSFLLLAGGLTGVVNISSSAKQQAQERYLSIVSPNHIR